MNNVIGQKKTNIEGKRMIVSEYRSANDMTIVWEEDNSAQITDHQSFLKGTLLKGSSEPSENTLTGMTFFDKNGEEVKVVRCFPDNTCMLRYANGEVLSRVPFEDLPFSNFDRQSKYEEGEYHGISGIDLERMRTFDQAKYLLTKFHRCIVIRPCGFGKTMMGMRLMKSPMYKKCLFLYPNKDAKNLPTVKNNHIDKVIDIQTYQWLIGQNKKGKISNLDYDFVFLDEAHFVGGDENGKGAFETYKAVMALINSHPFTHFLGATATPQRMDGIDVVSKVFLGHTCYPYSEFDAIEDGIIQKPFYYYNTYDVVKKIRDCINASSKEHINVKREDITALTGFSEKDICEFDVERMPENIRKACDAHVKDTSYMRFISFYLTHEELSKGRKRVEEWFRKAYPDHEVCSVVVTSESTEDLKTVENLSVFPSDSKYAGKIDIIFNCEMLCRGYHSENLTGVIMERKTKSFAKYMQMAGRLLSCDSKKPMIIFDIEDNIHSDFVFDSSDVTAPEVPVPTVSIPKTPVIFKEIEAAYPNAIDWDKVDNCAKKSREAEKITEELVKNTSAIKKDFSFISKLKPTEEDEIKNTHDLSLMSREEYMSAASTIIKERNLSFAQAAELTQSFLDMSEKNEGALVAKSEAQITETLNSITKKVETPVFTPVSKEESEEIGNGSSFNNYHYNEKDRELYKLFNVETRTEADFVDIIKENLKKKEEADILGVIKRFDNIMTAPTWKNCASHYSNYSQVDTRSAKYNLLKSLSEIKGIPTECVIQYMIEHAS